MKITTVLGALLAVVLLFFGFIFILSSGAEALQANPQLQIGRIIEGAILLGAGFGLAYVTYIFNRKPIKIIQQLEISGVMKAAHIKCPNCSASVDTNKIKISTGVPYATCPYCGTTFEVTEEPKW